MRYSVGGREGGGRDGGVLIIFMSSGRIAMPEAYRDNNGYIDAL